ncbi:LysR family transcriptional regulator [Clostridium transplantifaecale]|uniref:LysR family transcriptional regulator n=1 Tax=Clostridium transplantifaecale TaxID=2479838 RepID=UPI000F638BF9|nr:LysR family transcriptional regulator [Clostridium transplantifaecale]
MLNEMRYVYSVYQEKSFSKAAKKLFISQPALSNMVRKAENEIGAPIFDRSTIPLTVTKEGAYYIKSIEEILFIQRNLQAYFKDLRELNTGSLSIGGASFFCSFVFPDLIGRFREKYPNVTIDLLEGNVKELKEGLEDESLDLVIETALYEDSSVERFFFKNEEIILLVPASYPINKRLQPYRLSYQDVVTERFLSDSYDPVPLEVFKDIPFIIMKPGNDMYQRSFNMCRNAGFTPKVAIQMDQVLTSMNIASNGVGAVFIRADIIGCLPENEKLVYYKIGDPLACRRVVFASKKGKYITAAMREFLRMAGAKKVDGVCPGKGPCKTGSACKGGQRGTDEWN